MSQYVLFALVGLGTGAIYAALGVGLVVTFKGTGIINFAGGAMGMWSAYVYDEMRRNGDLTLPVVVIPHKIHLASRVAFTPALLLALASSAGIGLLAHFLVFRPLRKAPALAKVVASVGLMITLQALVVINFDSTPRRVEPILPNRTFELAGISIPRDRLWLTLIAVLMGAALWAYFRFTRLGLATRAAAENERAASLARFSPQFLAATTWLISSTVVGLLFILASPSTGLNAVGFTLVVVPALACALVGRLTYIGVVIAAGLALGAIQSEATLLGTKTWWPMWAKTGIGDAVPFLVVIGVLFLSGRSLPSRGSVEADPLPEVVLPRNRPKVVVPVALLGLILLIVTKGSYRFGLITSMIVAIIALSLVLLTGFIGQISLAQAAFAGSAGFAVSKLASDAHIAFPISTVMAVVLATILGVVAGLPALRIRGAQLAVVTLALAVALERFVFRNPNFTKLSGNLIPDPKVFGLDLSVRSSSSIARLPFGIMVLAVLVAVSLAVGNLARGSTGRRFLAVRSNERAAASLGIDVSMTKLTGFAIASALAGLGGTLIGYSRGQLSADSFGALVGVSFLAFAYLGGITSIAGALVAGTFAPLGITYVIFNRIFENLGNAYGLISGVSLILTAIFNPVGIAGATRQNLAPLLARFAKRGNPDDARLETQNAVAARTLPTTVDGGPPSRASRTPTRSPGKILLETDRLSVSYGGLVALNAVSVKVAAGQIVGLIGPNGAGKTTFIDALTGFVATRGSVRFGDHPIDGMAAHDRARLGLTRTWQAMELFTDLTVRDNALVASETATLGAVLADVMRPTRPADTTDVDWALGLLGLTAHADRKPATLSLGQQKLLGVARGLATRPKVVLLDEPAAGLDTMESETLGRRLHDIVEHDIAVLLIDHDMSLVLDVCDYIYVLEFGSLIAEGTPAQIRVNPRVVEAYLGSTGVAAVGDPATDHEKAPASRQVSIASGSGLAGTGL